MHGKLEEMVSEHGLQSVLMCLSYICYGRARDIRASGEGLPRATIWDFAAQCCMTAAKKRSVVSVSRGVA